MELRLAVAFSFVFTGFVVSSEIYFSSFEAEANSSVGYVVEQHDGKYFFSSIDETSIFPAASDHLNKLQNGEEKLELALDVTDERLHPMKSRESKKRKRAVTSSSKCPPLSGTCPYCPKSLSEIPYDICGFSAILKAVVISGQRGYNPGCGKLGLLDALGSTSILQFRRLVKYSIDSSCQCDIGSMKQILIMAHSDSFIYEPPVYTKLSFSDQVYVVPLVPNIIRELASLLANCRSKTYVSSPATSVQPLATSKYVFQQVHATPDPSKQSSVYVPPLAPRSPLTYEPPPVYKIIPTSAPPPQAYPAVSASAPLDYPAMLAPALLPPPYPAVPVPEPPPAVYQAVPAPAPSISMHKPLPVPPKICYGEDMSCPKCALYNKETVNKAYCAAEFAYIMVSGVKLYASDASYPAAPSPPDDVYDITLCLDGPAEVTHNVTKISTPVKLSTPIRLSIPTSCPCADLLKGIQVVLLLGTGVAHPTVLNSNIQLGRGYEVFIIDEGDIILPGCIPEPPKASPYIVAPPHLRPYASIECPEGVNSCPTCLSEVDDKIIELMCSASYIVLAQVQDQVNYAENLMPYPEIDVKTIGSHDYGNEIKVSVKKNLPKCMRSSLIILRDFIAYPNTYDTWPPAALQVIVAPLSCSCNLYSTSPGTFVLLFSSVPPHYQEDWSLLLTQDMHVISLFIEELPPGPIEVIPACVYSPALKLPPPVAPQPPIAPDCSAHKCPHCFKEPPPNLSQLVCEHQLVMLIAVGAVVQNPFGVYSSDSSDSIYLPFMPPRPTALTIDSLPYETKVWAQLYPVTSVPDYSAKCMNSNIFVIGFINKSAALNAQFIDIVISSICNCTLLESAPGFGLLLGSIAPYGISSPIPLNELFSFVPLPLGHVELSLCSSEYHGVSGSVASPFTVKPVLPPLSPSSLINCPSGAARKGCPMCHLGGPIYLVDPCNKYKFMALASIAGVTGEPFAPALKITEVKKKDGSVTASINVIVPDLPPPIENYDYNYDTKCRTLTLQVVMDLSVNKYPPYPESRTVFLVDSCLNSNCTLSDLAKSYILILSEIPFIDVPLFGTHLMHGVHIYVLLPGDYVSVPLCLKPPVSPPPYKINPLATLAAYEAPAPTPPFYVAPPASPPFYVAPPASPPYEAPVAPPYEAPAPPVAAPYEAPAPPVAAPYETPVPPVAPPYETPVPKVASPYEAPVPPVASPYEAPVPPVASPYEAPPVAPPYEAPPVALPYEAPAPPVAPPYEAPPVAPPYEAPAPPVAPPYEAPPVAPPYEAPPVAPPYEAPAPPVSPPYEAQAPPVAPSYEAPVPPVAPPYDATVYTDNPIVKSPDYSMVSAVPNTYSPAGKVYYAPTFPVPPFTVGCVIPGDYKCPLCSSSSYINPQTYCEAPAVYVVSLTGILLYDQAAQCNNSIVQVVYDVSGYKSPNKIVVQAIVAIPTGCPCSLLTEPGFALIVVKNPLMLSPNRFQLSEYIEIYKLPPGNLTLPMCLFTKPGNTDYSARAEGLPKEVFALPATYEVLRFADAAEGLMQCPDETDPTECPRCEELNEAELNRAICSQEEREVIIVTAGKNEVIDYAISIPRNDIKISQLIKNGSISLRINIEGIKIDDICEMPVEVGNCNDFVTRYYYDTFMERCHAFQFSGCEANANNFQTLEDCIATCMANQKCKNGQLQVQETIKSEKNFNETSQINYTIPKHCSCPYLSRNGKAVVSSYSSSLSNNTLHLGKNVQVIPLSMGKHPNAALCNESRSERSTKEIESQNISPETAFKDEFKKVAKTSAISSKTELFIDADLTTVSSVITTDAVMQIKTTKTAKKRKKKKGKFENTEKSEKSWFGFG